MPHSIDRRPSFAQKLDLQRRSTKLSAVDLQPDFFDEAARAAPSPVTDALIIAQPSDLAALKLAQLASGLTDKQIYDPLDLDKATWSRIGNGEANFPSRCRVQFQRLTRDVIPLKWEAHHLGYSLTPIRTALEERLADATTRADEAERRLAVAMEVMRELRR